MVCAGIICEYNPFHTGHVYQLETLRGRLGQDAGVICLMSGNYVQRGEPAIFDKWRRAGDAVRGGADLVLELPVTAAVTAAGYFAAGAVDCLAALGCVRYLCFGSEEMDARTLSRAAELLAAPEFEPALQEELSRGVSYAAAREAALSALGGDPAALRSPNNALGADYLRRLRTLGNPMEPVVIPRKAGLPSASDLRKDLIHTDPSAHTLLNGERAMLAVLRTLPDAAFQQMPFGGEGLWSKVMKACRRENSLEEILFACKSKRYAMSRLKRMLLCLFLGLSAEELTRKPPYLRVLAFNDRGRAMLRGMKETSALPLVTGDVPNTEESQRFFQMECRTTDLYGLFAPPGVTEPAGREKTARVIYKKS